ncbi:hypothetical protein [Enterococcus sp. AZ196]|uniref:hypothetical protein n=1 Tax=Enterococcus sp. AZ196 TaxID=2774659 RepID=UPI003D27FD64
MISERKKLIVLYLAVMVSGEILALTSVFFIYFNDTLFNRNIDIIQSYINASSAFFGCFFSVSTALVISQFAKYRERLKETQRTMTFFFKVKAEYQHNRIVLLKLEREIREGSDKLAHLLIENRKVRDLFATSVYHLEFVAYHQLFSQINSRLLEKEVAQAEPYLLLFEQTYQIYYLCQAIVEKKIRTEENICQLLLLITEKIGDAAQLQAEIEEEQTSEKGSTALLISDTVDI